MLQRIFLWSVDYWPLCGYNMPKTVQNGRLEAENEGGWGGKREDGVVRVVEDRIHTFFTKIHLISAK